MTDDSTTPPGAAATPQTASIARTDGVDLADLLRKARSLPWDLIYLECPGAFAETIGGELAGAWCDLECECGTTLRIKLDGESKARCPKCKTIYRHMLIVQAEDTEPSAPALAVKAILDENQPED